MGGISLNISFRDNLIVSWRAVFQAVPNYERLLSLLPGSSPIGSVFWRPVEFYSFLSVFYLSWFFSHYDDSGELFCRYAAIGDPMPCWCGFFWTPWGAFWRTWFLCCALAAPSWWRERLSRSRRKSRSIVLWKEVLSEHGCRVDKSPTWW